MNSQQPQHGIEEVKDLVRFASSLVEGFYEARKDDRLTIGDYRHFLGAVQDSVEALRGIGAVPAELKDLSQEEVDQLVAFFQEEHDAPSDIAEQFVETAVGMSSSLFRLLELWKKWKQRPASL